MSDEAEQPRFSWKGLFAFLAGGVSLFYYFEFLLPLPWVSPFGRALYVVTACLAIGWGAMTQTKAMFGLASASPRPTDSLSQRFSWAGVILILFGVEFLLMARKVPIALARGCLAVMAVSSLFFGIREISKHLLAGTELTSIRHRFALPRQGAVYVVIMIVLFVGSLQTRSNMLLLVFAMMAAPFVLNGGIIVSMLKNLSVTRSVPESVVAGERCTVELNLTNRKSILSSQLLTVTDRVANEREVLEPSSLVARIPANESRVARYQLELRDRGRYQLGPVSIETRYPLGIVERGITIDLPGEIIVFPRIGRLTPAWFRQHGHADEIVHRSDTKRGVYDDEFHRIREYRPGDNPRAIHWRSSARQGDLMIREFHQSRNQDLVILLDLWNPDSQDSAAIDRVELAISFAATISRTQMLRSRDSRVMLGAAGERFESWLGATGPAGLESLMKLLATLQSAAKPDLAELLSWGRAQRGPTTRTLLITSRPRRNGTIPALEETQAKGDAGAELRIISCEPEELLTWFWFESR
ncbi:DUF58 domain-containing protein [Thalassoroseus pseudoceratinae]|uniref:DUF58 domain-containing protein n=1 Tax=Thalassoroseus pseudoceratinae TaxID=2713176 RepID=UPI00141DB02A|nr:DUF58 domain-containing protein [Thalassoroseus pseudoceratinae]